MVVVASKATIKTSSSRSSTVHPSSSSSASTRIRTDSSNSQPSSPNLSGAGIVGKGTSSRNVSGRTSIGSNAKRLVSQQQTKQNSDRIVSSGIPNRRASEISNSNNLPLGSITNRTNSASYDEMQSNRKISSAMRSSDDVGSDAGDHSSDRIHGPRSSQGTNRSASHRVPSALRRLPPGGSRIVSRTIMPSGALNGTDPSMPSSSSSHQSAVSSRTGSTVLARANGRRSLGATLNAAAAGGAAQHDRDGREITKLTVDSTSFEEWMKMATDNKINATNTWNFALIDYFHDMSLLRSDNGDGSINFQKASCTLDGCVKVWTSRVDSVVVETGKLLSGLQDEAKENSGRNRGRNGDDEDGEGEEGDDENGTRKKKSRAKEPTLVKSFNQLAVKKLDLEFTVDPLFKKTSADFDEGGAGGLLMNHLGVDSKARVVFDASDVPGQDDAGEDEQPVVIEEGEEEEVDEEDEEEESNDGDITETGRKSSRERQEDQVDLTRLRTKLFGQHDFALGQEDALGSLLNGMTVCPTFASFRFSPDDNTPFSALMADNEPGPSSVTPFGSESMAQTQDWNDDMMLDGPAYDDGLDDAFGGVASAPSNGLFGGSAEPFDYQDGAFDEGGEGLDFFGAEGSGAPNGPIDFSSLQGLLNHSSEQPFEGDDFFGYFDQKMSKNWAGPEHWKMRNVIASIPGATGTAVGEKAAKKQKEPFVIDFLSLEGAIASKELFDTAKGQAGTLMVASKEKDDLYLLPEDRHFSSKQLLRLFIKPKAMLNPRRQGQMLDGRNAMRTDADADFWIQNAAQNGGLGGGLQNGTNFGFDDGDDIGMPEVPFDTQFFHEDDGGFDPMGENTEHPLALEPEDEEELATQALKRIRPEFVNYAKKAKRVDIRKLKDNIWRQLAIFNEEEEDEEENSGEQSGSGMGDISQGPSTPKPGDSMDLDKDRSTIIKRDPTDPRTFDSVLSGLRKLYPKDRMDEISTSFCFICLLHLANEEGLRIQTAPNELSMLTGKVIVEDDEDEDMALTGRPGKSAKLRGRSTTFDDELNGEGQEEDPDQNRVGFLEQLSIAKDPTAGRSA